MKMLRFLMFLPILGCYFIIINESNLAWFERNRTVYLIWFISSTFLLLFSSVLKYVNVI